MEGFIDKVAGRLYEEYGDEISSLAILFPSRRAQLFFADSLSRIADRPLWQPAYISVDSLMEQAAGIVAGDRIRLVAELYKVYSEYHDESFDAFYFWGETLFADFDSIDKYMIDADMLFSNISDLKELENDHSYLTPEQREVISRFWKTFGEEAGYSDEKRRFMNIWETLKEIYHKYRTRLSGLGFAYPGMVHRMAAENIRKGNCGADIKPARYVVAGFNALTKCEKVLFDHLARNHNVDFFWDYDRYYTDDPEQEAGLFLRENIRRYPSRLALGDGFDSFSSVKNITVVSAPSDTMQCRYVEEFLEEAERSLGRTPGKETAIVLTDENLLLPVLHSIPDTIEEINVTMGYPLRHSLEYAFVERLIALRSRRRQRGGGEAFYHSDVAGIANHPFLREADLQAASSLGEEMKSNQRVYIDRSLLIAAGGLAAAIFGMPEPGWGGLGDYLLDIISRVSAMPADGDIMTDTGKRRFEFFSIISENIRKLSNSVKNSSIELSEKTYASLLRKVLQTVRIPYEGEPLQGVQVMGILETRNLDFENVLLLSANDDTFPGNRAASSSFVPFNLRLAYGLPTPQHHEGVYAYYFYRLLQRAGNVHLAYSSRADEKSSGEQSRYIYQVEYESPHKIRRRSMGLNVNISSNPLVEVEKKGEIADLLDRYLGSSPTRLSPTALSNYVVCPLKFYFSSVAKIRPEEEVGEDIDAPMFGTILHRAMEILYRPLMGADEPQDRISSLIGSGEVASAVDRAIRDKYMPGEGDYNGNTLLVKDIICRYINKCILPYDAGQNGWRISELEKEISYPFALDGSRTVLFGGTADRIDALADGRLRIVDYKTGREALEFKGVEALFSPLFADQNPAAMQTLLYAMMMNGMSEKPVVPALYYVRNLNMQGYSPLLADKARGMAVTDFADYKLEFRSKLHEVLNELFDPDKPFVQCSDTKHCRWCDFNVICRR